MSSLSEIYFNYNQAIAQANKLDDIAKRLTNVAHQDMERILNEINSAWKSDNSPKYIQKGQKVEGDIGVTAGNIKNIASSIRTIAKRVLEAELEAWGIANERKN